MWWEFTSSTGGQSGMSTAVLTAMLDELDHRLSQQQQQQQQDDDSECGLLSLSPPRMATNGVAGMASSSSSPDRERLRLTAVDLKTTRESSGVGSGDSTLASPYKETHLDVQKLKEALQTMRMEKDQEIAYLKDQLAKLSSGGGEKRGLEDPGATEDNNAAPRLVPWMHSITERGDIQTNRLGRQASLKTSAALADLQKLSTASPSSSTSLAERMAAAFLNPVLSLPYLHSIQFGADLVELSAQVSTLFESESRCLALASPVYVFGDVHGNLADLNFFSSNLWRFGFGLTAGSFLFLGDYVDRGLSSLECVAYLFAQKLLHPHKVFLLRGNHETRAVNGLEHYYGSGCFLTQCRTRFGHDEGYIVWHQINHAFDRLPLAATIDNAVFCVHGGIPRPLPSASVTHESRLDSIRNLPTTAPMDVLDKKFYDANPQLTMVSDMLWGDPAKEEHEDALDPATGFGKSVLRGGNAVCFGSKAIDDFLQMHRFAYILRAHEAHSDGVGVSKSGKVLTIFSTSKDHALGDDASCGCVLVDRDRITAINRSAGQQQQLRRRRSITSLQPPPPASQACRSTAASSGGGEQAAHVASGGNVAALSPAAYTASSPHAAARGATRRRSSQRDAYPSSAASSAPPPASGASASSRRRRHDQDECDSTDDEAPTPSPRRAGASASSASAASSSSSSAPRAPPFSRPRSFASVTAASIGHDNNQSED